jgi:hypothetical protein
MNAPMCKGFERRMLLPRSFCSFALWVCVALASAACVANQPFPSDQTPEGAYARVTLAINDRRWTDIFPYLDDRSQWALHTIARERRVSRETVVQFPPDVRAGFETILADATTQNEGAEVFVAMAFKHHWLEDLARDLSKIDHIEGSGDTRLLVTAHGARYPFVRRKGGIWGLATWRETFEQEAERATRDRARIEKARDDLSRVHRLSAANSSEGH